MILRGPYFPSIALIRALARPQSLRCPLARPLPAQFARGKKTKSQKARAAEKERLAWTARHQRREDEAEDAAEDAEDEQDRLEQQQVLEALEKMKKDPVHGAMAKEALQFMKISQDPEALDKMETPIYKDGEERPFDYFEEDPVTGERVQVDPLGDEANQIKEAETFEMLKKYRTDSNYDAAELNKRMMDKLIANPAFADLTDDLKELKDEILTKEEEKELEEQARKDAEPDIKEMGEQIRATIHEAITKLHDDPDVGTAKEDLAAVLRKLPEIEDLEDPALQQLLDKASESVDQNPKLRAKIDASNELETKVEKEKWSAFEKEVDDLLEPDDPEDFPDLEDPEQMEEVMMEWRELMKEIETSDQHDEVLDTMLRSDSGAKLPTLEQAEQFAASVSRYAKLCGSGGLTDTLTTAEEEEEEHVSPELQAKVDMIMADPRLLEKLMHIQNKMAEAAPTKDLTQIDVELAPDPYEMDDSLTATLNERMAMAHADPEHRAALESLKVRLQPPYNISPALKSFNQAMSFAYVGANDDVRRVLWRCYQKARTLPTFLQNLSDDAWDILYYSQAVVWAGNQNRTDHLKAMLADLEMVGKDGPPTHPSQLGQVKEAARLEAAQKEQREAKWRGTGVDTQA